MFREKWHAGADAGVPASGGSVHCVTNRERGEANGNKLPDPPGTERAPHHSHTKGVQRGAGGNATRGSMSPWDANGFRKSQSRQRRRKRPARETTAEKKRMLSFLKPFSRKWIVC